MAVVLSLFAFGFVFFFCWFAVVLLQAQVGGPVKQLPVVDGIVAFVASDFVGTKSYPSTGW